MKKIALTICLFIVAIGNMGNQGCSQDNSAPSGPRQLRLEVNVGQVGAQVLRLPTGETVDFPYITNVLFYQQVMNSGYFVISNPIPHPGSTGTARVQATARTMASKLSGSNLTESDADIQVLQQFGFLNESSHNETQSGAGPGARSQIAMRDANNPQSMPACLYDTPLGVISGDVNDFSGKAGGAFNIGYGATPSAMGIGASIKYTSTTLEMGFRLDRPLSGDVIAIGRGVSQTSDIDVGLSYGMFGLDFFFQSAMADVIRGAMDQGLANVVSQYIKDRSLNGDWNSVWESRMVYLPQLVNGDQNIAIRAGARAGVHKDDIMNIHNLYYDWEDPTKPCVSRLLSAIPTSADPIAQGKVIVTSDNISILQVKYLQANPPPLMPGAQITVQSLAVPTPSPTPGQ